MFQEKTGYAGTTVLGAALAGLILGFILTSAGINSAGYMPAEYDDDDPVALYQQGSGTERTMAFYFKDAGYAYSCDVDLLNRVQVGEWTYMYDNGTECEIIRENLLETWDDDGFENEPIHEQLRNGSDETLNTSVSNSGA